MWVGFLSSFFAWGRKKQNKFPSNLHCLVKKLNPFFRYYLSLSYLSGRLSLHLLPTESVRIVAVRGQISYRNAANLKRTTAA
jgi:hypothetical protein